MAHRGCLRCSGLRGSGSYNLGRLLAAQGRIGEAEEALRSTTAAETLTAEHKAGRIDLRAEILKVPHHGSADFSAPFLEAVSPLVSVVSSGDESARKEYMHPRATLMGALGRHARDASPVVLVTELVAFFETVGWVRPDATKGVDGKAPGPRDKNFFAFRRTAYGLVRVRTDGERLLVYTNSGQTG